MLRLVVKSNKLKDQMMSKTRPKLDKSFYRDDFLSTAKTGFKIVALKIQKTQKKAFCISKMN